jgi:hypothetical protein
MVVGAVGRVAVDSQERFEQEAARWSGQPLVLQVAPVPGGPVRVLVVPTSLSVRSDPALAGADAWRPVGPGRPRAGSPRPLPAP